LIIAINCLHSWIKLLLQVAGATLTAWRSIGIHLGFTAQQLEDYATSCPDSKKDRLFRILCAWKVQEGKEATAAVLVDACTKARVGGAAKKVLDIK
jgi:hypothetical protein